MTTTVDPNFKTSLAPRKRARTSEEKEQRRMERILRNRRAAHASREKKRRHVEYLEAYVLSLEKNYQAMLSNVSTLQELLPSDKKAVSLIEPEDLSELKAKIHANISCMAQTDPASPCSESSKGLNEECDSPESSSVSTYHAKIKTEEPDSPLVTARPAANYHNYLSPVSINSPRNSPIDLTIKKEPFSPTLVSTQSPTVAFPNSDSLMFTPAASGPDFLAQNSAVILSLGAAHNPSLHRARLVRV